VQTAHGEHQLGDNEARLVLGELTHAHQVHEEVAAADEVHDEEDLGLRRERVVQVHEEGAVHLQGHWGGCLR